MYGCRRLTPWSSKVNCSRLVTLSIVNYSSNPSSSRLSLVSQLRLETGLGIQMCKNALERNDYDISSARQTLLEMARLKGAARLKDAEGLNQGAIALFDTNTDYKCILKLLCKTDFVAQSVNFGNLARMIADLYFEKPNDLENRLRLMIEEMVGVLQEPIKCESVTMISSDPGHIVGSYLHNKFSNHLGTISALVKLKAPLNNDAGSKSLANQIAKQIVGMNPLSTSDLLEQPFMFSEEGISVGELFDRNGMELAQFCRLSIR